MAIRVVRKKLAFCAAFHQSFHVAKAEGQFQIKFCAAWFRRLAFHLPLLVLTSASTVQASLNTESPINFFTNVAARLLRTDLNLDLTRIQIYPTNQYTPAVHRLLQVTANLYDATTNCPDSDYPFLPTVFRPLFRRDASGNVFVAGYREVTDTSILNALISPTMVDLQDTNSFLAVPMIGIPFDPAETNEPMASGFPLIIGAKKGFPNFNKFALENAITVVRQLHFHKEPNQRVSQTNQVYSLMISNSFGVQAWNSYSTPFPRTLRLAVRADITLLLTNETGVIAASGDITSNHFVVFTNAIIPANTWSGFVYPPSVGSFQAPLLASHSFLTNAAYVQASAEGGFFTNSLTPTLDPANTFRVPHWWLNVRTRVQFVLIDTSANRIVDYVNLDSSEAPLNIMDAMKGPFNPPCDGSLSGGPDIGSLWCTNRLGDTNGENPDLEGNTSIPTYGVWNQFLISLGSPNVSPGFWNAFNATITDKYSSIRAFQQRIFGTAPPNDFEAPFNPVRTVYQYVRWEANDPLVHYQVSDLIDALGANAKLAWDRDDQSPVRRLTAPNPLSDHYRPWGGNPNFPGETTPHTQYNGAVKDPLLYNSDGWNFPSGEPLSFAMLGRVHRGTPWQTIYLKSSDTDLHTWSKWTGDINLADASASRPINDRHLVDLFDTLVNTNPPGHRLSINTTDTNVWLAALDGMSVLTNASPDSQVTISSNSTGATAVVNAINNTRSIQTTHYFQNVSDLLAIPELSFGSPWLNTNIFNGATSDVGFEKIPTQLLPLLRTDSRGSITSYGGKLLVQFSGYDGSLYVVEGSSNLMNWVAVDTNIISDGVLNSTALRARAPMFYRSRILP